MQKTENGDVVDEVVAAWKRERPDLDLSAVGVMARLGRLTLRFAAAQEEVLAKLGLQDGAFDVLATLRRAGRPYELIPSQLSEHLLLSRSGMTSRLDRLVDAGLVERSLDPGDRRSFRVKLTGAGLKKVDEAMTAHTANISRLLATLSKTELRAVDGLLRKLALAADGGPKGR
jgi:DNA-binding MarR family transcriptional regulator